MKQTEAKPAPRGIPMHETIPCTVPLYFGNQFVMSTGFVL